MWCICLLITRRYLHLLRLNSLEVLFISHSCTCGFYFVTGVFGSLDMHGLPRDVYWTRLSTPAKAGVDAITLQQPVCIIVVTVIHSSDLSICFIISIFAENLILVVLG